ncbi:MAG: hypothetical protein KGH75_00425 [Rhodospirillales bacterium]|nr:hypothetical protein [Rhodospirillales bacterium]
MTAGPSWLTDPEFDRDPATDEWFGAHWDDDWTDTPVEECDHPNEQVMTTENGLVVCHSCGLTVARKPIRSDAYHGVRRPATVSGAELQRLELLAAQTRAAGTPITVAYERMSAIASRTAGLSVDDIAEAWRRARDDERGWVEHRAPLALPGWLDATVIEAMRQFGQAIADAFAAIDWSGIARRAVCRVCSEPIQLVDVAAKGTGGQWVHARSYGESPHGALPRTDDLPIYPTKKEAIA